MPDAPAYMRFTEGEASVSLFAVEMQCLRDANCYGEKRPRQSRVVLGAICYLLLGSVQHLDD